MKIADFSVFHFYSIYYHFTRILVSSPIFVYYKNNFFHIRNNSQTSVYTAECYRLGFMYEIIFQFPKAMFRCMAHSASQEPLSVMTTYSIPNNSILK